MGLISAHTYNVIANIKARLRDDTVQVVTMTETKSGDDIYGVADITSGIVTISAQFYWQSNITNDFRGEGGRVETGSAVAVIGYDDRAKITGNNIFIRKDGMDLRINRRQDFVNEKEVLLNLEKIV